MIENTLKLTNLDRARSGLSRIEQKHRDEDKIFKLEYSSTYPH